MCTCVSVCAVDTSSRRGSTKQPSHSSPNGCESWCPRVRPQLHGQGWRERTRGEPSPGTGSGTGGCPVRASCDCGWGHVGPAQAADQGASGKSQKRSRAGRGLPWRGVAAHLTYMSAWYFLPFRTPSRVGFSLFLKLSVQSYTAETIKNKTNTKQYIACEPKSVS